MAWQEIYKNKQKDVLDAIALIRDGDTVVTGFACGEPFGIEDAMVEHYEQFHDVTIVNMLTMGDSPWIRTEMKGHFRLNCMFASASNRQAVSSGIADFTTCHFYEIPEMLRVYICPARGSRHALAPGRARVLLFRHQRRLHQGYLRPRRGHYRPNQQIRAAHLRQCQHPCARHHGVCRDRPSPAAAAGSTRRRGGNADRQILRRPHSRR